MSSTAYLIGEDEDSVLTKGVKAPNVGVPLVGRSLIAQSSSSSSSASSAITKLIAPTVAAFGTQSFSDASEENPFQVTKHFVFITASRDRTIKLWKASSTSKGEENDDTDGAKTNNNHAKDEEKEIDKSNNDDDNKGEDNSKNEKTKKKKREFVHFVPTQVLKGHMGCVSDISLNPIRTLLISSSWDRTLRVWSVNPENRSSNNNNLIPFGKCLGVAKGHTKDILSCCCMTRDEKMDAEYEIDDNDEREGSPSKEKAKTKSRILAVSASRDGSVRIWYVGKEIYTTTKVTKPTQNPETKEISNNKPTITRSASSLDIEKSLICLRIFSSSDWISAITPLWCDPKHDVMMFLSGGYDGVLRKWKIDTNELLDVVKNHEKSEEEKEEREDEDEDDDKRRNDDDKIKKKPSAPPILSLAQKLQGTAAAAAAAAATSADSDDQHDHCLAEAIPADKDDQSAICHLSLTPDGSFVTSASLNGTMRQTNINDHTQNTLHMFTLRHHIERCRQSVFPSTHYWLVSITESYINFLDLEDRKTIKNVLIGDILEPSSSSSDDDNEEGESTWFQDISSREKKKKKVEIQKKCDDDNDDNNNVLFALIKRSIPCGTSLAYASDARVLYVALSDGSVSALDTRKLQSHMGMTTRLDCTDESPLFDEDNFV